MKRAHGLPDSATWRDLGYVKVVPGGDKSVILALLIDDDDREVLHEKGISVVDCDLALQPMLGQGGGKVGEIVRFKHSTLGEIEVARLYSFEGHDVLQHEFSLFALASTQPGQKY